MTALSPPVFATDGDACWRPDEAVIARSRLGGLLRRHGVDDVPALHRRAVEDPEWYWRAVVEDLGINFERPFACVLDTSAGHEFPRWFSGGAINLAANCADRHADGPGADHTAVTWEAESGETRSVSYANLRADVVRFARYLRSIGVGKGDCVGLFVPMVPETAVAFLACARIGAVVVPAFSGYGPDAVASRLQDCEAKVLITADGFHRKGRFVEMKPVADRAVAQAPLVEAVVVIERVGGEAVTGERQVSWDDTLALGEASGADGSCASLDPNDPLMVIYTSGTTGRPKGIVHSHGGFLAKAGQDFGYSFDVQRDDVLLWITDIGWLMGPLLIVGSLMFGATAVFYEGVSDHPDPGRIWSLVERHGVTLLGISPTTVRSLMAAGDEWTERHRLDSLRAFATTGEPWNPEPWRWLFEHVGQRRLPILNYSGGTEIGGGILTCYTILPLKPCCFAGPVVGMHVDVVDEAGRQLRGEVGELVIRNLWPGMTHGFWKDQERYLKTYWSGLPGIWTHGDLARVDENGYWYVTGRSDDTIKLAGKRVGPAEVESAVVAHPAVEEAAVIGVPDELKGQALACFIVLVGGQVAGPQVEQEIRESVVDRLGKTLALKNVYFVAGLPKTRNGKIVRRVILGRHLGRPLGDLSSLDDPSSLELIPPAGEVWS